MANVGIGVYNLMEAGSTWRNANFGYIIGFGTENVLTTNTSLNLLANYEHKHVMPYKTTVYDVQLQRPVELTVSFTQQELAFPITLKYNHSFLSIGGGLKFSYLMRAVTSLSSNGDVKNYVGKYDFSNSVSTAPYSRFNVSPILNIGIRLNRTFSVQYYIGLTLIKDPQQFVFNEYRILQQSISIITNLNKL